MLRLDELKLGSVVRLASGSPKFSVCAIDPKTKTVDLHGWHDRHGEVELLSVQPILLVWPAAHRDKVEDEGDD